MSIILTLFITSVFFLLMTLLGYPLLIFILAKFFPRPVLKGNFYKRITIIIPCYNEEHIIKKKIENTFSLDFPGPFEILVIDSNSNDNTLEELKQSLKSYSFRLIKQSYRKGKASAINTALKYATGEIVILTDADALLKFDSVKKILRNFSDPTVGGVVARYAMQGKNFLSKSVAILFSIFREGIRHYESIIDSSSYFTGECIAFRRFLIKEIDENTVADDQFILFSIRQNGYRCVTEKESLVSEQLPVEASGTFEHRKRTMFGTLKVSAKFKHLFFKKRFGFFGLIILPFSLARLIIMPFVCLFVEIMFIGLLIYLGFFYIICFVFMLLLLIYIIKKEALAPFASIIIIQAAMIFAIFEFLKGNSTNGVWKKNKKY